MKLKTRSKPKTETNLNGRAQLPVQHPTNSTALKFIHLIKLNLLSPVEIELKRIVDLNFPLPGKQCRQIGNFVRLIEGSCDVMKQRGGANGVPSKLDLIDFSILGDSFRFFDILALPQSFLITNLYNYNN